MQRLNLNCCIFIYIMSAFRNSIHIALIISCGHNETWSHDNKTYTTFRYSPCCFPAANGAWFWYVWLSYEVFCLAQVIIGVRGNVILLSRPSNCKWGRVRLAKVDQPPVYIAVAWNHQGKEEGQIGRVDVLIMKMWV